MGGFHGGGGRGGGGADFTETKGGTPAGQLAGGVG